MSEDIKEQIKKIFGSPETSAKMIDLLVTGKKPSGWSRRSTATYYGESYALQVKKTLDAMLVDRQDRIFRYDNWSHMSHNSVYLRINQSIRYLLEELDQDHTYAKLMRMIAITRERNQGVKLTFKEEFRNGDASTFEAAPVVPASEAPKWKQKIELWLEESEPGDKPFVLDNLMLSQDEVKELKLQFLGLKNVIPSITAQCVKLMKINPPS
jgi:hypothetical protein